MRAAKAIRRGLGRLGRRPLLEGAAETLAFLGGLALVAVGVGMVFLPAGLVVAGVELAAAAALHARSPR